MPDEERIEGQTEDEFLVSQLSSWLQDAETSTPETVYRETSVEDYDFYAGRQDTDEVLDALEDLGRPASVYNEVKPKIDMLIGMAKQNKYKPDILPVGKEDEPLAELVTGTMYHYRRQLKMSRKEGEWFEHAVKGGRSLLYFYTDSSNPFEPKIKCKRVRGDSYYYDPDSQEYDRSDARYLFVDTWVTEEEIKVYWPDYPIEGVKAGVSSTTDTPTFFNEATNKYRLVEGWYKKFVKVIYFQNPQTGEIEKLSPSEFTDYVKVLVEGVPDPETGELKTFPAPQGYDSYYHQIHYCIFSAMMVLEKGESPYKFDSFPAVELGAYKDDDNNAWFGAITPMKDPQRGLNTIRRQLVHLLQTLPKGILMHEVGAILDIEAYEERSSDPSYHMEIKRGDINNVRFEKQPTISNIYQVLDGVFAQGMKDASGIQNEMMGVQTTSREPGISVRQRQVTGLVVLYILFDNFSESRHLANAILLSMIQQYVSESQLVRIEGPKGQQLLEINSQINPDNEGFNDITTGKFDLVLDESAETITSRISTAQILTDFAHNNPGTIPPDLILEYADVPFTVKQRVMGYLEEQRKAQELKEEREFEIEMAKVNKSNKSTEED